MRNWKAYLLAISTLGAGVGGKIGYDKIVGPTPVPAAATYVPGVHRPGAIPLTNRGFFRITELYGVTGYRDRSRTQREELVVAADYYESDPNPGAGATAHRVADRVNLRFRRDARRFFQNTTPPVADTNVINQQVRINFDDGFNLRAGYVAGGYDQERPVLMQWDMDSRRTTVNIDDPNFVTLVTTTP